MESITIIANIDDTTDDVVALPTPSAPPVNVRPRYVPTTVMITANYILFINPVTISRKNRDRMTRSIKVLGESWI